MTTSTVQRVLEMARQLSDEERAEIAGELLAELDYPGEHVSAVDADGAWCAEAQRRALRLVRGESKGVPAEEVHAKIEAELTKRT